MRKTVSDLKKWFHGRTLWVVSKHEKERVLAPIFESALGVSCAVADFDTDTLGTFTGEIERTSDPLSTVRQKCLEGLKGQGADLALATEGSFGPHPTLGFVPAHEEFMILIDQKWGFEVVARRLTTDTNFGGDTVAAESDLWAFADRAGFPNHALILRPPQDGLSDILKGIRDENTLLAGFQHLKARYGAVQIETDMRAHLNPTRLMAIGHLGQLLLEKLHVACPQCQTPGFDVRQAKPGLPCDNCRRPTRSTLSYVYKCHTCAHTEEALYPHQRQYESPTFCDYCNP